MKWKNVFQEEHLSISSPPSEQSKAVLRRPLNHPLKVSAHTLPGSRVRGEMFRTLRVRFVVGCAFLVFLIVAVAEISLMKANELVAVGLAKRLDLAEASFNSAVEQESLRAFSMAEIVARDPEVIDAFAAHDRARLQQLLGASFAELKARHGVEQAHFHLPPAISFLRLYMPETFGDDISAGRKTVVEANQSHKPARGIETGHGGLGFRAVVPVAKDGRHIGTFEYGVAFNDTVVKKVAAVMQADIAIYFVRDGQFDILGTTFPASFKPQQKVLASALNSTQSELAVKAGGATLAMRFVPIRNYAGTPVAVAAFGVDRRQFQEMLDSNLSRIGAAALGALVLLGIMALAFLFAVIQPVTNLVRKMRRLADGDLTATPSGLTRKDEIGDMCRAVEVFRTNAVSHLAFERSVDREHRESRLRQEHMEQVVARFLSDAQKALAQLAASAKTESATGQEKPAKPASEVAQILKSRTERFLSEVKAA
jgi:methyl-accepting chemotaxis protein